MYSHEGEKQYNEIESSIMETVSIDDDSRPYYTRKANIARSLRFDLIRGVTYIPAFLFAICQWVWEIFLVFFGIRSTYSIATDDEFVKMFDKIYPFGEFTTEELMSFPGNDEPEVVRVLNTSDVEVMKDNQFPGTYMEPVKIVMRKKNTSSSSSSSEYEIYSINIQNVTMLSSQKNDKNTDAWDLAKLFALSALHYFRLMKDHPYVHMQQELLIAATFYMFDPIKTKKKHEIYQLLCQHFDFTSDINYGVLETKKSPLYARDSSWLCYDAHTVSREGNQDLIGRGFEQASSSASAKFGHPTTEELAPHFQAILSLTTSVVNSMMDRIRTLDDDASRFKEHDDIFKWITFIQKHMFYPSMPEGLGADGFIDRPYLSMLLADYIYRVSVVHSAEHHFMAISDQRYHPMSIWTPWSENVKIPRSKFFPWRFGVNAWNSSAKVVPLFSLLKQLMYNNLFAKWTNNYFFNGCLHKTIYEFESNNKDLQESATMFRQTLASLPDTFLPPSRCARSVMW